MMATKKVLLLHGYAQSAAIFAKRLAALRKQCAKEFEFVFVDAPIELTPADIVALSGKDVPTVNETETNSTLASLGAVEAQTADPVLKPRGWWRSSTDKKTAQGLEITLHKLRDILKEGTFEGVLGFSQGAALAALIAALLERPESYPPFLVDGKPPHPPFKFCLAACGFLPLDDLSRSILTSYSTPSLYVFGRGDAIVSEQRAQTLIEVAENCRVEWHDGGHFIPSKAPWRKFLFDYMRDPTGNLPSPSPDDSSTPTSGAVTPREPPGIEGSSSHRL